SDGPWGTHAAPPRSRRSERADRSAGLLLHGALEGRYGFRSGGGRVRVSPGFEWKPREEDVAIVPGGRGFGQGRVLDHGAGLPEGGQGSRLALPASPRRTRGGVPPFLFVAMRCFPSDARLTAARAGI